MSRRPFLITCGVKAHGFPPTGLLLLFSLSCLRPSNTWHQLPATISPPTDCTPDRGYYTRTSKNVPCTAENSLNEPASPSSRATARLCNCGYKQHPLGSNNRLRETCFVHITGQRDLTAYNLPQRTAASPTDVTSFTADHSRLTVANLPDVLHMLRPTIEWWPHKALLTPWQKVDPVTCQAMLDHASRPVSTARPRLCWPVPGDTDKVYKDHLIHLLSSC